MKKSKGQLSALITSIVVHGGMLVVMAMIQRSLSQDQPELVLDTVFEEERVQEEFSQELEEETEVAETQNFMSGGAVSTAVGGSSAPAVAQTRIDQSESLQEPDIQVNASPISMPGEEMIGEDLGMGEVSGEIGAVVEGYGAALSRLTREIIRLMRNQKVLVVWLFDESESMKDDQEEIGDKFHKVYEELGIQQRKDESLRRTDEILWTSIVGFGQSMHELTPKPTTDIKEIRAAIDKIGIDDSGKENMCQSIGAAVEKYSVMANRGDRRLVVVVVSDESPSDDELVEETIKSVKKARSPVYILGREAIFGYPYARIRWKDPIYNLNHWVRINRGPETAFPECLQYNGLGARYDSFSSGFGPYSQVRICKESGGIFFMLPGEEEDLTGPGAHRDRKFEALAMKEYRPLLLPRREYAAQRDQSNFRSSLWSIIRRLNPHQDSQLSIRHHHYPIEQAEFVESAKTQVDRIARAMGLLTEAVTMLNEIEPERATESSQRWRANYDLILAQCLSYRVRLFQLLLAFDEHVNDYVKPKDPKHNEWNIRWTKQMRVPDEDQFQRVKKAFQVNMSREEYLEALKEQERLARDQYAFVREEHPGTPWAQRAQFELSRGFGFQIVSGFHDPRYREVGKKINIPNF